ncbi:MAG: hypothetical protein RJA52_932 [Bacteroidota bacterium]|jgi:Fe-S-cluster containining protein
MDQKFKNKLKKLGKNKPQLLDEAVASIHEDVFSRTNCLECANCCKTTSPIFINKDIERIAGHLKMKPGDFILKYLKTDEEGDYVLTQAPCPFLSNDNTCIIYDLRPRACKEYPHTNRKNFYQIIDLTLKNQKICPAVDQILKELSARWMV